MAIVLPKFPRRRSPTLGGGDSSPPAVNVALCRGDATYIGGESISVRCRICRVNPRAIAASELSVLWYTEGQGDEDLAVHQFVRRGSGFWAASDLVDNLVCHLPPSPLSYRGHLITVRWCVRFRVMVDGSDDIVTEIPFHLVPPQWRENR